MKEDKFMKDMGEITLESRREQIKCKHNFTHVSNKGWWGCEVIIYCKKCGWSRKFA